jgi:hypothetical protein
VNTDALIADQQRYFDGAYEQFLAFGGPCVYFHQQCLAAGEASFLSDRHIEMLYATLTSWGMHRMGDVETTRTKLSPWSTFRQSLKGCAAVLEPMRRLDLLALSASDYSDALTRIAPAYAGLRLSVSGATIVVNSKALYHLLPRLIPPIDRQYTIRFFQQKREKWRNSKGQFRQVMLPLKSDAQFALFRTVCLKVHDLANRVEPALLMRELREHGVTVPKALDNAIVHFVRFNGLHGEPDPLTV